MSEPVEDKIDRLEKTVDKLAVSVKNGFSSVDKRLNNIESDLKSFKIETRDSFSELNEKMDNLTDVVMENHDKRIEALEEKVLG